MDEELLLEKTFESLFNLFPSNAQKQLGELRAQMEESRKQYKEIINQHYEKNSPFLPNRVATDANIRDDLARFIELAAHCIVVGDADILYTWIIKPLKEGRSKLASDNLAAYKHSLSLRENSSTTPRQEKIYLKILIEELEKLEQGYTQISKHQ